MQIPELKVLQQIEYLNLIMQWRRKQFPMGGGGYIAILHSVAWQISFLLSPKPLLNAEKG